MRPTWLDAGHTVESAFARSGSSRVRLVVDAGVEDAPVHRSVRRWLEGLGARSAGTETLVLAPGGPDLDAVGIGEGEHAVTVVVGGGGVIDRVKLETLPGPGLLMAGRSGLLALPPGPGRAAPLVAVPTTLGTGAEASAVVLATRGGRRLLVMGRHLRPGSFAHDPAAYATLPPVLIREGLAEILSRLVGPLVGDLLGDPLTDGLCLAALDRLVRCGDTAVAALDLGRAPAPAVLAEAARIGVLAHSDHVQRPHAPWAVKLWALANEVASAAGAAKVPTTTRLWPAFWEAVDDGGSRWGSAERLHQVWAVVRAAHLEPLPARPADGIRALLHRWGVPEDVGGDALEPARTADQVLRAWGAGLPVYHGVRASDIEHLLERARRTSPVGLTAGLSPLRDPSTPST